MNTTITHPVKPDKLIKYTQTWSRVQFSECPQLLLVQIWIQQHTQWNPTSWYYLTLVEVESLFPEDVQIWLSKILLQLCDFLSLMTISSKYRTRWATTIENSVVTIVQFFWSSKCRFHWMQIDYKNNNSCTISNDYYTII